LDIHIGFIDVEQENVFDGIEHESLIANKYEIQIEL
jgi:hypothetical protein